MPSLSRIPRRTAAVLLAALLSATAAASQEPFALPQPEAAAPPAGPAATPAGASSQPGATPQPSPAPAQATAPATSQRAAPVAAKSPAPPPEARISQDPQPTLHAGSLALTATAARRYAEIAARGGWPLVPEGPAVKPGQDAPSIPAVRARLAAEGEAIAELSSTRLDPALAAAVRRFQWRHGLPDTGIVGPATVREMNVPVERRQQALAWSAQRLADTDFSFGSRHVVVNLPSAAVEAISEGAVVRRYVAVVGDPKHPSPTVVARIGAINLNPTWTLPVSIVRNEIIPKMRKDPTTLSKQRIRIYGASGQEIDPARIDWSTTAAVNYTLRQDSGTGNALGQVRIAMPNSHDVYMHDTPSKRHFANDRRFLSHGCVRVSGVVDLAAWLLEAQGFSKTTVETVLASGERKDLSLARPVPVAWVYLTGWVTADGSVHFRDDVYGLDRPDPLDELFTATISSR